MCNGSRNLEWDTRDTYPCNWHLHGLCGFFHISGHVLGWRWTDVLLRYLLGLFAVFLVILSSLGTDKAYAVFCLHGCSAGLWIEVLASSST